MSEPLPAIHSRGPGVKKAFAALQSILEPGEVVEAFFHLALSSSVAITNQRTFVVKSGQIGKNEPPIILPQIALLRLEKRGILGRTFLVHEDVAAEFQITEGDLKTLRGLVDSAASSVESPDANAGGTKDSQSVLAAVTTWIQENDAFRKPVEDSLLDGEDLVFFGRRALLGGENASVFITNLRIGLTNKFCIIAQFNLTNIDAVTYAKSMGKQRVLLRLRDGREYKFGKVDSQEESIAASILDRLLSDPATGRDEPFEFAALQEDEVLWIQARQMTNRFGDNNRDIADKGQGKVASAELFRTAIRQGNIVRPLDGDVSAEVQSGGGIQVSHRPTLARMAAGSILPGTALIPGLAFQKKKTIESRTTYFAVIHPEWTLDVNVDPDHSADAIRAAKIINKRAESLNPSPSPTTESGEQAATSPAEQIREMKLLLDEGTITQEEFDAFKGTLFG